MSTRAQDKGSGKTEHTLESGVCVTIPFGDAREFYMTMRQSLLQQVSAIEKILGLRRRCKHCGNDL